MLFNLKYNNPKKKKIYIYIYIYICIHTKKIVAFKSLRLIDVNYK